MVAKFPKNIRRDLFIRQISRNPTTVNFRGYEIDVRFSEMSHRRKLEIVGYTNEEADIECFIALPIGDSPPKPKADKIIHGTTEYRVLESQEDLGENCFNLTLSKRTR